MPAAPRVKLAVWTVWAVMLAVALISIARYGPQIPRAEDWLLVPALTGNEPNLLGWLWEQNSEHRVPLPRLAYLTLLKVSGGDFRAAMVFDTLALGALAGAMMLGARHLRGRYSYADAFFPLVLLHLGHWDNLVWSWQIQFVLSTLAAGTLLLIVAVRGAHLTARHAALAGICLVAVPLCGANGLALVPFLGAWLGYVALGPWPESRERATRSILTVAVAAASVLVVAYFVAYERASWYPASPGVGTTLKVAAQFLAMAFGPGTTGVWRHLLVVATLALLVLTALLLIGEIRHGTVENRWRALGLLCVMAAIVALGVAVGWGRAGRVAAGGGLSRRYALLAAPVLCAVFFAWQLHGSGRWATRVQMSLLLISIALLPANTASGLLARDWVRAGMDAVQRDIDSGMPRVLLAERHQAFLLHWDGERLANGMRMLREAGIGPFARLREDFAVEEVELAAEGAAGDGGDVAVRLVRPTHVYAVRVRLSASPESAKVGHTRVVWRSEQAGPREDVSTAASTEGGVATATVWINDVIDGFRIRCDQPTALRQARVLLVVPRT